jgi:hypothetical protein
VLNCVGCRGLRNLCQNGDAGFAVVASNTDFYQLMRGQADVYFFEDGRGQALVADHDDRVDRVSEGFQRFALAGCELGTQGCL